jgi:transcriptional regulator with XRE-family HTH domain
MPTTEKKRGRVRIDDVDRLVGRRVRIRRLICGLTQQQMAALIGVTYQQAHKYEVGINRIAAGRLYSMAQVLGVEVGYFFEDVCGSDEAVQVTPEQRMLLELARSFVGIPTRRQREAVLALARGLATQEGAEHE